MPITYLFLKLLNKLKLGYFLYPIFSFFNNFFSRDSLPNINESREILLNVRSHENYKNYINNNLFINKKSHYDLQIIIPVYNSEKYITDCINSVLFQKTEYTFQIIVINDGSTDNTGKILNAYKNNKLVKIINQKNEGRSAARNTGLRYINSRYVMFLDSDDELSPNAIQHLLFTAYRCKSDMVIGGYTIFNNKNNKKQKICYPHRNHINMISSDDYDGYVWGKVIKSSLFMNIHFPVDYEFEDTIMAFWIYPRCSNICSIHFNVYLHRNNPKGISHSFKFTNISIDSFLITKCILSNLYKLHIPINKYIYNSFLSQVKMNCMRNMFLEKKYQKSIFVLTCKLFNTYFKKYHTNMKYYIFLENSLKNKDYRGYILFCILK